MQSNLPRQCWPASAGWPSDRHSRKRKTVCWCGCVPKRYCPRCCDAKFCWCSVHHLRPGKAAVAQYEQLTQTVLGMQWFSSLPIFCVGEVMTTSYHKAARSRSMASVQMLIRQRRSVERRARWTNTWTNFKKLLTKKFWIIKLAVASMVFGAVVAYGITAWQGDFVSLQMQKLAFATVVIPVIPARPMAVAVPDLSPPTISTPVAASGDETVPRLKLSSQISLTVPIGDSP